jgi:hypothetical protein
MDIKLKNGETTDIKLDRVEEFDPRSRNFSIGDLRKSGKSLRSYTWRCNDWFDQGNEGACVGFSLGHELSSRPCEVKGLTNKFLREGIYWEAQKIDPWPGGEYPGSSPKYSGTSLLAGVKVLNNLGYIGSYRWAFNTDDALYGIGHNGPAVIGIKWFYDMYFPDKNGFIKPTGMLAGGHAIIVRGVNVKGGYVTLRNSWGRGWGVDGDCYLTFSDFDKLLKDRGECCFLLNRKSKI